MAEDEAFYLFRGGLGSWGGLQGFMQEIYSIFIHKIVMIYTFKNNLKMCGKSIFFSLMQSWV
jgi:hypothetical protein